MPKQVKRKKNILNKHGPFALDKVRNVPKMVIDPNIKPPASFDPSTIHSFSYEVRGHDELPHVVKFSGGRSSGMLLFMLLEGGLLKPERGDVVVFNNTSAEHPETYHFTAKCKRIVEEQYGIPFFWVQFQTYEDARGGEWVRLPTYRLVKPVPWSEEEPDGYHWRGETFEEMLSWSGYVPNQFQRICTKKLKLEVTRSFLRDWFACKENIEHLGHYGNGSRMDDNEMYARHQRKQGQVPQKVFLKKKAYVRSCKVFRPEQFYVSFSRAARAIENTHLAGKQFGNEAFFGDDGVEYVTFVGLRYDEMHRVVRVRQRNSGGPESDGHEGEHVYMPLASIGVTKKDVNAFWSQQTWGLELPSDISLSNCVYCFLKGASGLRTVHKQMEKLRNDDSIDWPSLRNSPCDINWWRRMEKLYGRDMAAEQRVIRSEVKGGIIGFFGTQSGFSYDLLAESGKGRADISEFSDTVLPCDCTD